MQKVVHRANERGVAEHEWLHSRFSFSFADWYEPTRMGFGALRVINDDIVDPSSGFPMHPHRDMEIITIVMKGAVTHEDSMGNHGVVGAGEVQVMSAGTGVVHSEFNESPTEQLELFQIWIIPDRPGHTPRYAQQTIPEGGEVFLVGPEGSDAPLTIHQDAYITRLTLTDAATYTLHSENNGLYVLVISGEATIADEELGERDAVGLWETPVVAIEGAPGSELLLLEVPLQ